ncbi:SDR family oxidoreductase, partial [Roseomonas mucosa]|uniref:SDR family oxidoreductase n=1 Tax=Roseomonas mucosa TaxID=207340 RepID=UPI001C0D05A5
PRDHQKPKASPCPQKRIIPGLVRRSYTRAASKELGGRGISVTAIGPGPMDTPFFYPAEGADAVAYHKSAAALSPSSKTGLTDIEDIVPWIRFLVSEGWWMTGQTILVNGGYTTK